MRANQFITNEMKQRLDAKCWKGKHKEGTKVKGGIRVNNCVPNESIVNEKSKSEKQARFMAAAAHDPQFASRTGIKQSVAKEFNKADTGTKKLSNAMKHKPKKKGFSEGAPIVVALAPIDVRNPKKSPQPYRNKGDIVPDTKPPSTEKRGVKGLSLIHI